MKAGRVWFMAALAVVLLLAGCGGDDSSSDQAGEDIAATSGGGDSADVDGGAATTSTAEPTPSEEDDPQASSRGASGGTLVLGDETITLDSTRCFLQEQDAAAGGGKILFVAQAFGSNSDGEPITLDVSRYDEDSQFTGDDIIVDIGDPFSDSAVSLQSGSDLGTVAVNGNNLSAAGLSFVNWDDGSELAGSFDVNC